MKYLSRSLTLLLVLGLIPYAALTVCYSLPEHNPLQTVLAPKLTVLDPFLTQKWSFFAPPPVHNNHLYYVFSPPGRRDDTLQFEALGPVLAAKAAKAPFNDVETIMDYVLHGTVDQVHRFVINRRRLRDTAAVNSAALHGPPEAEVINAGTKLDALRTLERYAAVVAASNHVPAGYDEVKIVVTAVPLPDFAHRYQSTAAPEGILYETTPFRTRQFSSP